MTALIEWFFQTPLSRAAVVLVLIGGLLLGGPVGDLLGWNRWGTRIALWGLGGALIPTFVSRIGFYDFSIDFRALNDCVGGVTRDWGGPEELLNLLLLVPFGAGLVLASRSFPTSAAAVVFTAIGIELAQSVTGLGTCERGDMVRNAAGGLLAVVITRLVVGESRGPVNRPTSGPGAAPRQRV